MSPEASEALHVLNNFSATMFVGIIGVISLSLGAWLIRYQDEKPRDEKSDFDILFCDAVKVGMLINIHHCVVVVIYVFCPPFDPSMSVYFAYSGYFIGVYFMSCVNVAAYIKYVFVFQPDDVENLNVLRFRRKTFASESIVFFLTVMLDTLIPTPKILSVFETLSPNHNYEG